MWTCTAETVWKACALLLVILAPTEGPIPVGLVHLWDASYQFPFSALSELWFAYVMCLMFYWLNEIKPTYPLFSIHHGPGISFAAAAAKSLQLCPTLCNPIDSSPPGSSVPGILQARTLEWVAISFSNAGKWTVKVKSFSHVRLATTPWLQPTRLLRPWDFPGKSTGVGCHFLLRGISFRPHQNHEVGFPRWC